MRTAIKKRKKRKTRGPASSLSHVEGRRRGIEGAPRGPMPSDSPGHAQSALREMQAYRRLFEEYKKRKKRPRRPKVLPWPPGEEPRIHV
jgi:hypothetical protein